MALYNWNVDLKFHIIIQIKYICQRGLVLHSYKMAIPVLWLTYWAENKKFWTVFQRETNWVANGWDTNWTCFFCWVGISMAIKACRKIHGHQSIFKLLFIAKTFKRTTEQKKDIFLYWIRKCFFSMLKDSYEHHMGAWHG